MATSRTDLVKRLEDLKLHLQIGADDHACWCIEQVLQPLIAENTLPLGKVVLGQLCCPKGHPGNLSYVEPSSITRRVVGFVPDDGQLVVDGDYTTDDETDGSEAYLLCTTLVKTVEDGHGEWCDTAFTLPPGVEIDFT